MYTPPAVWTQLFLATFSPSDNSFVLSAFVTKTTRNLPKVYRAFGY